jgi:hypothetical protein
VSVSGDLDGGDVRVVVEDAVGEPVGGAAGVTLVVREVVGEVVCGVVCGVARVVVGAGDGWVEPSSEVPVTARVSARAVDASGGTSTGADG